jgi:predicted SnoaL-like aldol condensation-catalyzing enzyme
MHRRQTKKTLVIQFYNALVQGDIATLRALGRPDYIQHNPAFETGLAGLNKRINERPARPLGSPPIPALEFVRTAAEGDFLWLLRKMPPLAPGEERANVDIFRVQDARLHSTGTIRRPSPAGASHRKTTTADSDGRQYQKEKRCVQARKTVSRPESSSQQLEYAVNGAVGEAVTDADSDDVINPIILRSRRFKQRSDPKIVAFRVNDP